MTYTRSVTNERRLPRRDPSFRTSREFQRHATQRAAFRLIRATDAVPGRKTWRESYVRSGSRLPLHTDVEIIRAALERAVASGDPAILEKAIDEVWDVPLLFTRLCSRLVTDARAQMALLGTEKEAA